MIFTAGRLFEVVPILTRIINENRPMPLRGAYRLASLHARLAPEYLVIERQRDALILAYDYEAEDEDGVVKRMVPPDKAEEFRANWGEIAGEEVVSIDVEPIPLAMLDLGAVAGPLTAAELIALHELVVE